MHNDKNINNKTTLIYPILYKNATGGAVQIAISDLAFLRSKYKIIILTVSDIDPEFMDIIKRFDIIRLKTLKGRIRLYSLLNPFVLLEAKIIMYKLRKEPKLIVSICFRSEVIFSITSPKTKRIYFANGGIYSTITGRLLRLISLWNVTKFIATSDSERNKLLKIKIPDNKITVIYNGISILYDVNPVKIMKHDINICCIGYYNKNKNQLLAVYALRNLISKGYKVKLNLYGSYEFSDKRYIGILNKKIEELNLKESIFINDFTPINEILNKNQFLLSVSKSEGFGNAILEAMAYKRPIITTNCGGLVDYLENKVTAILIDNYEDKRISDGIEEIIENVELVNKMIQNAYNLYIEKFEFNKNVEKFENIISELIKTD